MAWDSECPSATGLLYKVEAELGLTSTDPDRTSDRRGLSTVGSNMVVQNMRISLRFVPPQAVRVLWSFDEFASYGAESG